MFELIISFYVTIYTFHAIFCRHMVSRLAITLITHFRFSRVKRQWNHKLWIKLDHLKIIKHTCLMFVEHIVHNADKSLVLFIVRNKPNSSHCTFTPPSNAGESPANSHSPQEVAFSTPATSHAHVQFLVSFIDYRNNSMWLP